MNFLKFLNFARTHKIELNPSKRYVGIIFTLVAWFLLGFCTVIFKEPYQKNPAFVNFFFQFASMFLVLLIFSIPKGLKFLKPVKLGLVLTRGFIAVITYYSYFIAKVWISDIDNSMLFSTDALIIPIILFFLLNIKIDVLGWIGILIGFIGIGFVYSFDIKLNTFHGFLGGCTGIFSGFGLGVIVILTSYMVKNDPPLRIALYQSFIGTILSGIIVLFNWEMPQISDLLYMICTGTFFALALFLFLDSFFYTEPYVIGVLGYSLVFFVEIFNGIIYKETISSSTIIGSTLICTGGALTIWDSYRNDKHQIKH